MGIVSLTTYANYNSIGNDINVVGTFSGGQTTKYTDKHVSAPLMNYVEPYEYKGTQKTLFYTEVNTGLKVGERVFIVNGNYDSTDLIKKDKYKKGADGYVVLYVDRCRIALDIDYTGVMPNNGDVEVGDLMSDYIKIYPLDSYDSFLSANRQLTSRGGYMGGRYDFYQNNVAFIDYDYSPINDRWTNTTGVTASPGFYVREPAYNPNLVGTTTGMKWYSITNEIMGGSFSIASSTKNPQNQFRFFNNNKFMVMDKGFTYGGVEYTAGTVYEWDSATQTWKPDVKEQGVANKALITKANFRDGNFVGTLYSGIYGSREKKLTWTGDGIWLGGTLFNTRWLSGSMFSTILLEESYKSYLDRNRKPQQKLNTYNNGGYGFNYVIDSDFDATSIYGSIVRNTRFGLTPSIPVVENHITSSTQSFEHVLSNGLYESCYFNNTLLLGGAVKNSRTRNSVMDGVKHINSWAKDTVFKNSTLIADPIIKIDGYDEWSASEKRGSSIHGAQFSDGVDFKVYKFYIGEGDYFRLKSGDTFYIRGLKISNDPELLNLFDRKFRIGTWTEYVDDFNSGSNPIDEVPPLCFYKKGISCAAFLVSEEENEWIYNSVGNDKYELGMVDNFGYLTDTISENPNPRYSIDIFVSTVGLDRLPVFGLDFNYPAIPVSSLNYIRPTKFGNRIDVADAYIIDSDIESGIIENSTWNNGSNIGYNKDLMITGLTNSSDPSTYRVTFDRATGRITVTTLSDPLRPEIIDYDANSILSDITVGDVLFINGLDHYSEGKVLGLTISDPGTLYVDNTEPLGLSYSGASASTDGYGLTINYITEATSVVSIEIVKPGLDYKVGDVLYINVDQQGSLNPGGTGVDAKLTVTSVDTTPATRLPDSWKVVQYTPPTMVLSPMYGANLIKGLTDSGTFTTKGAANRWLSFGRTKITGTKIKSGIFKRSQISSSLIENENYDTTDIDFANMTKIKSLVMSDIVFSNNGNKLSLATYFNSSIFGGTDEWRDGIIYRSVLNRMVFNKGVVKESSWLDGTFNGGLFYNSRSYDGKPKTGYEFYYNNRLLSHYKGGTTSAVAANDRYSWRKGEFNGGEFRKSDWESGNFNGGSFIGSKWYNGVAEGGIFGNESTGTSETSFFNGTVLFTTVANANFVADDTSGTGVTNSIVWEDGIFNGGQFGSTRTYPANANPITLHTYTYPQTLKTIATSTTLTANVPINIPNIAEVRLRVTMIANQDISDLRIGLVSPTNRKMLVKDFLSGTGYKLDTTFSNDTGKLSIDNGASPYIGVYRFAVTPVPQYASNDYSLTLADTLDNGQTIGNWLVEITSIASANITSTIKAELTFVEQEKTSSFVENSAIWKNGTFNSGQFISYAQWLNGEFNGGKFTSVKGWETSGQYYTSAGSYSYTWVDGTFNGGEFGNSSRGENSTWNNGEFKGGIFAGRVWNNGIFKNGIFNGSGGPAQGGWIISTSSTSPNSVSTKSNAIDFVNNYKTDFYGMWKNGLVTDRVDASVYSKKYFSTLTPNSVQKDEKFKVNFNNVLWRNGIFDHKSGQVSNSVWISGTFSSGTFVKGSFNPYVDGAFSEQSVWESGTFNDGDFFFSEWRGGDFIYGTGFGMWFRDGTAYYMNAVNVVWGSTTSAPVWKNGNWSGSAFDYDGTIADPMYSAVLLKSWNRNDSLRMSDLAVGNNKIHVWNVFEDLSLSNNNMIGVKAGTINVYIPNYTPSSTIYEQNKDNFLPPVVW